MQGYIARPRLFAISEIGSALDKRQKVPDHSREIGLPVAFIRMINGSAFSNRAASFDRWIEGFEPYRFEPYRNEMAFERSGQPCYSHQALTAPLNQSQSGFVFAGFAAEAACLSTLTDVSQRSHKVKVASRCDASAIHGPDDMSADETHRAVSKISGPYAEVFETTEWIVSILPRKFGNGKKAGE